jgi:hypothetical protein
LPPTGSSAPEACPACGRALRRIGAPDVATVARYVGGQLLLWAGVALVLAYLAAQRGEGEWYAGLAAIAIVAWLGLRPRPARYHCETCSKTWPSA